MLHFKNGLLTLLTLGGYYPWARAALIGYTSSNTTLDGHPFFFVGTGREMFQGFLFSLAILSSLALLNLAISFYLDLGINAYFLPPLFVLTIAPFAIHGHYRYSLSKTLWNGIRFGYVGKLEQLYVRYAWGGLLTLLTFGFFGQIFRNNIRKYIIGNIRFGNAKLRFIGSGREYLKIMLLGPLLTFLTLGFYWFQWQKRIFDFVVDNTELELSGKKARLRSTTSFKDMAMLMIGNALLLLVTLGIARSWTVVWTLRFQTSHIDFFGNFSIEEITQSQTDTSDATGEDMSGFIGIGELI